MLCQFERLIYPQSVSAIDAGSFMIAMYRPCEKIKDSAGDLVTQVKAVGYVPANSVTNYRDIGPEIRSTVFSLRSRPTTR